MQTWALILQHEVGIDTTDKKTKLMHIRVMCDVTVHGLGDIYPIIIREDNKGYKLSEAKVKDIELLSIILEVHVKEGQNFHPIFTLEYVDLPMYECRTKEDLRHVPHYLDYEGVKCLHIGSRYRR